MSQALEIINASIAYLAKSKSPDAVRALTAGEITMAYKLKLISYEERDGLLSRLITACDQRRNELRDRRIFSMKPERLA